MNGSVLLGILMALAVFFGGLASSSSNVNIYFNIHALLIVIGGTFAAALVSFPMAHLWQLNKLIIKNIFRGQGESSQDLISEIIRLATLNHEDPDAIRQRLKGIKNSFLQEALGLYVDSVIATEKIEGLLKKRAEVNFLRQEAETNVIRSIARFPPAFGLLGAVMGMITLLRSLGSPDSFKHIGPAMAMAMVATMYGIAMANFILLPISNYLSKIAQEEYLRRSIIIDGVKLIHAGEHPLIIEENLRSYLTAGEKIIKKASAA